MGESAEPTVRTGEFIVSAGAMPPGLPRAVSL